MKPKPQLVVGKQQPVAVVVKPKEKTLQKTPWICKENIEDSSEGGDQPCAAENGL